MARLANTLETPVTSAEWSLGFTHPEIYEVLSTHFGIRTTISTITSIPTGKDTKYKGGDLNKEESVLV